jgi:zona occludens toxin
LITLITAPPGGGKSYYAVRRVADGIMEGKPVAGNVRLVDGWERKIAGRNWVLWVRPFKRRWFLANAATLYHFTEDLDELFRLRLGGEGESRGRMVLDEGHNWMNARSWSAGDRARIVRFFSQHRKLGWDVDLIAQHAEMIDKQVRNLCEYIVYLRNMKKASWGGVRIFPFNLFLAVTTWHAAQRVVVKRELFRLTWRKDLYDTNQLSHGLEEDDEGAPIPFPSPPEDRGQAATRTDARPRPGAGARPPAGATDPAPDGLGEGIDGEHAGESGEPETWVQEADFTRPGDRGSSNSRPSLKYETDNTLQ